MEKPTRKKILGGYPAVGVVISVTLTLVVIGIFGLIGMYSHQFEKIIRENISFKVYLKTQLSETQLKHVGQTLTSQPFVAPIEKAITFTSRDEAKEIMKKELGDYELVGIDNPYKDMFSVRVASTFHTPKQLDSLKAEIEKINGVIDVQYEKDLLDQINSNFAKVSLVLIIIAAVFLITVILLINNTLRLALFSQRFLIRSMQLVGAKSFFIQRPFLWRACLYGLLAAVIASGILWGATQSLYRWVPDLLQVHDEQYFMGIMGALIIFGMLIASVSTYFTIRRYLTLTLDELY